MNTLTEDDPAEFVPLGDGFRQASSSLYDALNGLSDEMEELNNVLQTGNSTLTADLRAINQQFNVVFSLVLDAADDLRDTAENGMEGVIQDTSEEDIAATREGKASDCTNLGTVEGDRNVGGLAGRMDLGTALECQNYGPAASTGGNYVGGVAQIPFLYGEDLSQLDLPPVPEMEGNYGVWPEFDVSGLRSDLTVNAVYTPWITLVASPELSGKLSLALAEGQFTENAVLHVTDSSQTPPPEAGGQAVVWDVVLTGAEPEDSMPDGLVPSGKWGNSLL